MGLDLIFFLRKHISKEQKLAFFSTFLAGLLIHLFIFTNYLPNRDAVQNFYTDQNILASGRWALSLACGISSYFDISWVIGVISCCFIALTSLLVVTLFKITNPVLIFLTGGLLVSSPAISETFFFLFTADGYMISLFLSALAVYLSRLEEKRPAAWFASAVCICVSCGIYQAYVSFSLIFAICYFMDELFRNTYKKQDYYSWILRQIFIFVFALVAYFLIWKVMLRLTGTTASDYQGINEVGKVTVQLLVGGLFRAIKSFAAFFIPWNIFKFGLTPYITLNLLFIVFFVGGLVAAAYNSQVFSRRWAFLLVLLCLLAIIPFACIWHFTSDTVSYRAMMLHSLTILFIFSGVNFEQWANTFSKNLFAALLFAIILNNTLIANIGYSYLHLSYEHSYAEAVEMFSEYKKLSTKHEINRIAVLGSRYNDVILPEIDPETGMPTPIAQINIIGDTIDQSFLYDSQRISHFLNDTFHLNLEYVHRAERLTIFEMPEVQSMGIWPAENSICVIDDILVIKLNNQWDR